MNKEFHETLERCPIIAAVFEPTDLEAAIQSPCEVIFLLSGSICNLEEIIHKVHFKDKKLYIHIDLLEGVANDRSGIHFIKQNFSPDGIITTKSNVVRYAKEVGLFVVQRFFILDSKSFDSAYKTVKSSDVDAVEILPGILPDIIRQISECSKIPVIAGGLIRNKKNAIDSLAMGAMGVSTSCKKVWNM